MFKSIKKVIVGVLAASLMLSSVAFAADATPSATTAPETSTVVTVNKKTVSKVENKATVELGTKVQTVKANAIQSKTTTVTFKSKKKVTVTKNAFAKAKKLKTITVQKNRVTFQKGAFGKLNTKKMTIKVKGLKASSKAYKNYVKALKKAGFEGKVKAVK